MLLPPLPIRWPAAEAATDSSKELPTLALLPPSPLPSLLLLFLPLLLPSAPPPTFWRLDERSTI